MRSRAPTASYPAELSLREGRARYFEANGLGDGGYHKRFVKLQAGPVPLYILNTSSRVRAVRFHDLHHVLTEYPTSWRGEAEIGAWEIASGCADHYAAWFLNLWAVAVGLFIDPAAIYRAFLRGRRTRNLYREPSPEPLLDAPIRELRRRLELDATAAAATPRDRAAFAVCMLAALAAALATLVALVGSLGWLLSRLAL